MPILKISKSVTNRYLWDRGITDAFRSSPIPSLLVDAGVLPLDLRRQFSLLRCWFRTQRFPESVPCRSILRDSRSPAYATRSNLLKPFWFRTASVLSALSVPSAPLCPYRSALKVGHWQFPDVSVCAHVFEGKKDLPAYASCALFLEHCSSHSDSVSVFTDGSKFDTGVGFSVVFPSFCRGVVFQPSLPFSLLSYWR